MTGVERLRRVQRPPPLVPDGVTTRPGILDLSALRFLLDCGPVGNAPSSGVDVEDPDHQFAQRPESSELARIYGCEDPPLANSWKCKPPRRSRQRRRMLSPMTHFPDGTIRSIASNNTNQGATSQHKIVRHGRRLPSRTRHHQQTKTQTSPGAVDLDDVHQVLDDERKNPRNPVAGPISAPPSVALAQEIQWIHKHLPVVRLAQATRCSVGLRRELFGSVLRTNLVRGFRRWALQQWRMVINEQKAREVARLKACDRLIDGFTRVAWSQLARAWHDWQQWTAEHRATEQHNAARRIGRWYRRQRQRQEAVAAKRALDLAHAMQLATANARRIQRVYRVHRDLEQLRQTLRAGRRLQRFLRSCHERMKRVQQAAAAEQLARLYAAVAREQQRSALLHRSWDIFARKIQRCWNNFVRWREEIAIACINELVDKVEFFAAVMSIQSHIRGFQCRFRLKRRHESATMIGRTWRRFHSRSLARQSRKMQLLARHTAASCLQRTFKRNQELRRHRLVMQKSTRPMYMRALGRSESFRERYVVQIAKSAADVIASTWRRHICYVQLMRRQQHAATRIQNWCSRIQLQRKWRRVVFEAREAHAIRRHAMAARALTHWARACLRRGHEAQDARMAQQFDEILRATLTIQRVHRRRHDRWRGVSRCILRQVLPRYREAARRLQRWSRRKLRMRRQEDGGNMGPIGVAELNGALLAQQRKTERADIAARQIQRAYRRQIARRDGRLLLKRYKLLNMRELRRKQQRLVIHRYLVEEQDARSTKQQQQHTRNLRNLGPLTSSTTSAASPTPSSTSSGFAWTSGSATSPPSVEIEPALVSPVPTATGDSGTIADDNPDVARYWSEEHGCFYLFNTRTGESTWC